MFKVTTMKTRLLILLTTLTTIVSVYSEPPKSDLDALQGKWKGADKDAAVTDNPCYLTLSGKALSFIGSDTNEWYKGTFVLHENASPKQFVGTIKDCPSSDCIGLTVYAIYKIEDGKFTICGSAPGETNVPSSFDAAGTRKIVFKEKVAPEPTK
jgi:uncharacterized protein (TIGR03067 family)